MQIFPKESIGIEIVPARYAFTMDQKLNFEEYYSKEAKKEAMRNQRAKKNNKNAAAGSTDLDIFGNG